MAICTGDCGNAGSNSACGSSCGEAMKRGSSPMRLRCMNEECVAEINLFGLEINDADRLGLLASDASGILYHRACSTVLCNADDAINALAACADKPGCMVVGMVRLKTFYPLYHAETEGGDVCAPRWRRSPLHMTGLGKQKELRVMVLMMPQRSPTRASLFQKYRRGNGKLMSSFNPYEETDSLAFAEIAKSFDFRSPHLGVVDFPDDFMRDYVRIFNDSALDDTGALYSACALGHGVICSPISWGRAKFS